MNVFRILTVKECSDLAIANIHAFNNYIGRLYAAHTDGFIDSCDFIKAKMDAYAIQREGVV